VFTYNANARHEFAYVAIVMDSTYSATGLGIEALFVFCYYCFSVWPFAKLYFEALGPNWYQFSSGQSRSLFHEEGRLRNHAYVNGQRTDMHIAALYPDELYDNAFFMSAIQRLLVEDNRSSLVPISPQSSIQRSAFDLRPSEQTSQSSSTRPSNPRR